MRNKEIKIFLFEVILYDISIQKLGRVGPLQQWSRQYRANIPIIKGKKPDFSRNATIFKLLTKLLVCCVCFFAIFLCDSNILGLVDLSIRVRLFTNLIKGHWSTVEKKNRNVYWTQRISLWKNYWLSSNERSWTHEQRTVILTFDKGAVSGSPPNLTEVKRTNCFRLFIDSIQKEPMKQLLK